MTDLEKTELVLQSDRYHTFENFWELRVVKFGRDTTVSSFSYLKPLYKDTFLSIRVYAWNQIMHMGRYAHSSSYFNFLRTNTKF